MVSLAARLAGPFGLTLQMRIVIVSAALSHAWNIRKPPCVITELGTPTAIVLFEPATAPTSGAVIFVHVFGFKDGTVIA